MSCMLEMVSSISDGIQYKTIEKDLLYSEEVVEVSKIIFNAYLSLYKNLGKKGLHILYIFPEVLFIWTRKWIQILNEVAIGKSFREAFYQGFIAAIGFLDIPITLAKFPLMLYTYKLEELDVKKYWSNQIIFFIFNLVFVSCYVLLDEPGLAYDTFFNLAAPDSIFENPPNNFNLEQFRDLGVDRVLSSIKFDYPSECTQEDFYMAFKVHSFNQMVSMDPASYLPSYGDDNLVIDSSCFVVCYEWARYFEYIRSKSAEFFELINLLIDKDVFNLFISNKTIMFDVGDNILGMLMENMRFSNEVKKKISRHLLARNEYRLHEERTYLCLHGFPQCVRCSWYTFCSISQAYLNLCNLISNMDDPSQQLLKSYNIDKLKLLIMAVTDDFDPTNILEIINDMNGNIKFFKGLFEEGELAGFDDEVKDLNACDGLVWLMENNQIAFSLIFIDRYISNTKKYKKMKKLEWRMVPLMKEMSPMINLGSWVFLDNKKLEFLRENISSRSFEMPIMRINEPYDIYYSSIFGFPCFTQNLLNFISNNEIGNKIFYGTVFSSDLSTQQFIEGMLQMKGEKYTTTLITYKSKKIKCYRMSLEPCIFFWEQLNNNVSHFDSMVGSTQTIIKQQVWNFISQSMLLECSSFIKDVQERKFIGYPELLRSWIGNVSSVLMGLSPLERSPMFEFLKIEKIDPENEEFKFRLSYNIILVFRLLLIRGFKKGIEALCFIPSIAQELMRINFTPTRLSFLFDIKTPQSIYDLILLPFMKYGGLLTSTADCICELVYFSYLFLTIADPNKILQGWNNKSMISQDILVMQKLHKIKHYLTYYQFMDKKKDIDNPNRTDNFMWNFNISYSEHPLTIKFNSLTKSRNIDMIGGREITIGNNLLQVLKIINSDLEIPFYINSSFPSISNPNKQIVDDSIIRSRYDDHSMSSFMGYIPLLNSNTPLKRQFVIICHLSSEIQLTGLTQLYQRNIQSLNKTKEIDESLEEDSIEFQLPLFSY